jgi:hypothetical protein
MKKYFVEILCLAVFLGMLFAQQIFAECVNTENTQCFEYWQNDMALEVRNAVISFYGDIDENPTDTGCLIAEMRLKDKINSILFSYKSKINQEMNDEYQDEERALEIRQNEDEEAELQLDAYGAYMDTLKFQD